MKLIHWDCLEEMKKLKDNSVDLIVTDPPYGVNFKIKWDKKEDVLEMIPKFYNQINKLIKDWWHIFIFVWVKNIENWIIEWKKYLQFNNIISTRSFNNWSKTPNNSFGYQFQPILHFSKWKWINFNKVDFIPTSQSRLKDKRNKNPKPYTYEYPNFISTNISFATEKRATKIFHPTEKSVKLISFLIWISSKEWETVLDPFMWSGSCGIACKNLNRDFIWIELDEKYFNIAEERILNTNTP